MSKIYYIGDADNQRKVIRSMEAMGKSHTGLFSNFN